VFGTNKRGYPVLSKAHQDMVAKAYKHNIQIILTGEQQARVAQPGGGAFTCMPAAAVVTDGVTCYSRLVVLAALGALRSLLSWHMLSYEIVIC
jgi:hypothetical protein